VSTKPGQLQELNRAEQRFLLLTNEQDLLEEIADVSTSHQRRAAIGDRLAEIGDTRPGVGLGADGLPGILWCEIAGCEIRLRDTEVTFPVTPFRIAKYPTTWAQYLVFLQAPDGYANPSWWDGLKCDEPPGDTSGRAGNRPAEFVSWYDAMAFCRWLSSRLQFEVRLPTEYEWEAAATSGDISSWYPWGGEWDPQRANTEESGLNRTTAVGMYPNAASRSGVMDLSGNVWEWCFDTYLSPFDVQQRSDQRRDLTTPIGAEPRALRGGGWSWGRESACVTRRDRDLPDYRSRDHGFRLAASLSPPRFTNLPGAAFR
jgi:formylglycine-generating enzyme required for sulfatase activity